MNYRRIGEEAMSGKLEACAECSKLCQLVHQRSGDPSSPVTSFFKIMFGANYSEVLFLPPKFARTISDLIGQEAQLEDLSGQQWTVTVSNVDDSLAFYEGWNIFSKDQRLMLGDVIVFHYIAGSHFVVQIYGRSGCQKYLRFKSNENPTKKNRTEGNFIPKDGPCCMNDNVFGSNGSMGSGSFEENSQHQPTRTSKSLDFENDFGRLQNVSGTRQYEEPLCIINRDTSDIHGEYRTSLYDLSTFEFQSGEKSSVSGSTMPEFPIETKMVDKDPINCSGDVLGRCIVKPAGKGKNGVVMPNEEDICQPSSVHPIEGETSPQHGYTILNSPTEVGMVDKDPIMFSRHVLKTFVAKEAENRKKTMATSKEATLQNTEERSAGHLTEKIAVSKKEPADTSQVQNWKVSKKEPADTSQVQSWKDTLHGNEQIGLKNGSHTFNLTSKDDDAIFQAVKPEPIDFDETPLPNISDTSYLVVIGSENYLELPSSFPPIVITKARHDRKVVFLRGPDIRLWPALYIHKYGIKVLKNGWEAFRKANGIQPGDEYLVESEKHQLHSIYRFRKVSK